MHTTHAYYMVLIHLCSPTVQPTLPYPNDVETPLLFYPSLPYNLSGYPLDVD